MRLQEPAPVVRSGRRVLGVRVVAPLMAFSGRIWTPSQVGRFSLSASRSQACATSTSCQVNVPVGNATIGVGKIVAVSSTFLSPHPARRQLYLSGFVRVGHLDGHVRGLGVRPRPRPAPLPRIRCPCCCLLATSKSGFSLKAKRLTARTVLHRGSCVRFSEFNSNLSPSAPDQGTPRSAALRVRRRVDGNVLHRTASALPFSPSSRMVRQPAP